MTIRWWGQNGQILLRFKKALQVILLHCSGRMSIGFQCQWPRLEILITQCSPFNVALTGTNEVLALNLSDWTHYWIPPSASDCWAATISLIVGKVLKMKAVEPKISIFENPMKHKLHRILFLQRMWNCPYPFICNIGTWDNTVSVLIRTQGAIQFRNVFVSPLTLYEKCLKTSRSLYIRLHSLKLR